MGTRASIGFRHEKKDWLMYHHSDGGLPWLGMDIMAFCKSHNADELRIQVGKLIRITDDSPPTTAKQFKEIAAVQEWPAQRLTETLEQLKNKDEDKRPNWDYALGDVDGLDSIMTGMRYWPDYGDFIYDDHCEYAYIVNLDTEKLEIFTHHYDAPHHKSSSYPKHKPLGRYSGLQYEEGETEPTRGATLILEVPLQVLNELPTSALKSYAARIDRTH